MVTLLLRGGRNCMRTKLALSDSLNNRILCETIWDPRRGSELTAPHPFRSYVTRCCNASPKPAHECSSLNTEPGAKGHFHLNKAKGLGEVGICETSLLDHRQVLSSSKERENAPAADTAHQKGHSLARKQVTLDRSSDLQKEIKSA